MGIIEKREKLREQIVKKAREWAKSLPLTATVILIGSYARGDFNLWSDVDILLISNDFKGNPVERLKCIDAPPGFQVIPITLKEFERLVERKNQLAVEAINSGIVLRSELKLNCIISFQKPQV